MKEFAEELEAPSRSRRRRERDAAGPSAESASEVERLFYACELRLGRFLGQMVNDRQLAEDLLQDSFYEALRCGDQLGEIASPEAWIFGIARNRALAALRRRRRLRGALERLVQRPEPSERDDLELLALRDLLERHLDPEDRALLILRYLHGFEATELAAMTGRTPEAVRQRLARAKTRLIGAAGRQPSPDHEEKET
jgi:RNA polymerase sigma-70 factor, ECF subfamily